MNVRSSEEIINNYDAIAELCRSTKEPVFLTKDGELDLVVMDAQAYKRREMLLNLRYELLMVEMDRLKGSKGCTVDEISEYLDDIIKNAKHEP